MTRERQLNDLKAFYDSLYYCWKQVGYIPVFTCVELREFYANVHFGEDFRWSDVEDIVSIHQKMIQLFTTLQYGVYVHETSRPFIVLLVSRYPVRRHLPKWLFGAPSEREIRFKFVEWARENLSLIAQ